MLYDVLSSREAINGLNNLSREEEAVDLAQVDLTPKTAQVLSDHDLIFYSENQATISVKGKQFLFLFDELKQLVETKKKGTVRMSFSLRPSEQDILLLLAQRGDMIFEELQELAREKDVLSTKKELELILNALEEIKLIKRNGMISATLLGKKTMAHFLLDEFNLHLF